MERRTTLTDSNLESFWNDGQVWLYIREILRQLVSVGYLNNSNFTHPWQNCIGFLFEFWKTEIMSYPSSDLKSWFCHQCYLSSKWWDVRYKGRNSHKMGYPKAIQFKSLFIICSVWIQNVGPWLCPKCLTFQWYSPDDFLHNQLTTKEHAQFPFMQWPGTNSGLITAIIHIIWNTWVLWMKIRGQLLNHQMNID